MSTKFLSSAVLMELAVFMKRRRIRTIVEWAPREFNRESDNLANGITEGFNPALEMKIWPEEISWEILLEALEAGREAERAYGLAKERGTLPNRERGRVDVTRRRRLELWIFNDGTFRSGRRRKEYVWPHSDCCFGLCSSGWFLWFNMDRSSESTILVTWSRGAMRAFQHGLKGRFPCLFASSPTAPQGASWRRLGSGTLLQFSSRRVPPPWRSPLHSPLPGLPLRARLAQCTSWVRVRGRCHAGTAAGGTGLIRGSAAPSSRSTPLTLLLSL